MKNDKIKEDKIKNEFVALKNERLVDLMDDHFSKTNDITMLRKMHILKDQILDAISNGWTAKSIHRYLVERGIIKSGYSNFLAILRRNNIAIKIHGEDKKKASLEKDLKELKRFLFRYGFDETIADPYLEKIEDQEAAADVLRQLKKLEDGGDETLKEFGFELKDLSLQEKYNLIKKVLKRMADV